MNNEDMKKWEKDNKAALKAALDTESAAWAISLAKDYFKMTKGETKAALKGLWFHEKRNGEYPLVDFAEVKRAVIDLSTNHGTILATDFEKGDKVEHKDYGMGVIEANYGDLVLVVFKGMPNNLYKFGTSGEEYIMPLCHIKRVA